jgi:hypothetical protein
MPTANDSSDANTAKVSASFSMRTAVMLAVVTVASNMLTTRFNGGNDAVLQKLDELNTRVSRIEGALAPRTSMLSGTEGAGGTAAYASE